MTSATSATGMDTSHETVRISPRRELCLAARPRAPVTAAGGRPTGDAGTTVLVEDLTAGVHVVDLGLRIHIAGEHFLETLYLVKNSNFFQFLLSFPILDKQILCDV